MEDFSVVLIDLSVFLIDRSCLTPRGPLY